ncbi:MAG: hypothetical protein HZC25_01620 [Rhodospirillales bacterium]|nr:hypothetical protein [Rhodospirillales bacterium]
MKKLFARIRLLPVMIFMGVLLMSLKVGGLIDGFANAPRLGLTASQAQQATQPPPAKAPTSPAKGKEAAAPAPAPPAGKETPPPPPPGLTSPGGPDKVAPVNLITGEPGAYSQGELEILQKLAARRDELDARAKEIELRETMAKAAEVRVDKKLAELKQMQTTIEGLLRKHDEQEDAKMKSLVKIYETMKPKDAARIFEELELPVLLGVIERMKEQKAASVIAEMNAQKAKTITGELAERRRLPQPTQRP